MSVPNAADLKRLGITREAWQEHQAVVDAAPAYEVRCAGGYKALSAALKAANLEWVRITDRNPPDWDRIRSSGG